MIQLHQCYANFELLFAFLFCSCNNVVVVFLSFAAWAFSFKGGGNLIQGVLVVACLARGGQFVHPGIGGKGC